MMNANRKRNLQGLPRNNGGGGAEWSSASSSSSTSNSSSSDEDDHKSCFVVWPLRSSSKSSPDNNKDNNNNNNMWAMPTHAIRSSRPVINQNENAEQLIVHEMNALSLEDRQRAYEELHAVPTVLPEHPSEMATKLQQMDGFLEGKRKKRQGTAALEKVLFLRPHYAQSLKVPFLRAAQKYSAQEAADRYVSHWERKAALFGMDVLARNVLYSDLTDADVQVWNGSHQILRDRAGRLVLFGALPVLSFERPENFFRLIWYLLNRELLADEDLQRKGMVFTASLNVHGTSKSMWNMDYNIRVGDVVEAIPLRIAGVHFCCWNNTPHLRPILSLGQMMVGDKGRVRFRSHYGSPLETQYELMTFGLPGPHYEWPVQADGSLMLHQHERYKQQAQQQDEQLLLQQSYAKDPKTGQALVMAPTSKDILFGIGRPYREYPGNVHFLQQLEQDHMQHYFSLTTQEAKAKYNASIVQDLQERQNCRFLKRIVLDQGDERECWVEATLQEARFKVSQTFRNIKYAQSKKQQQQQKKKAVLPLDEMIDEDIFS